MRKFTALLVILSLAVAVPAFAAKAKVSIGTKNTMSTVYNGFGIGLVGGYEDSIVIKKWMEKENAFQAGLGYNGWYGGFSVYADYLWHFYDIIKINPGDFTLYAGAGASVGTGWGITGYEDYWWANHVAVYGYGFNAHLRIPLGISYVFEKLPIDLFLEIVPQVGFGISGIVTFNGGLGGRWYF